MTVFISCPYYGRNNDEILYDLEAATIAIQKIFQDSVSVRTNYSYRASEDCGRLNCLGEAIKLMDGADAVYFCKGWESSKGCQVEHYICELYGIQRIEA